MGDDYGGTGGGKHTPVIDRLDPLFTTIAKLLGELAGNEAALEVVRQEEERDVGDGWSQDVTTLTYPGTYGFETTAVYWYPDAEHNKSGDSPEERRRTFEKAVDKAWHDAYDEWTSGSTEPVYRTTTQSVWEPDPVAMADATADLSGLVQWLNSQVGAAGWAATDDDQAPDWLVDLEKGWPATSQSPQSFYAFWDDVNDKCALYLNAAARLTATSAQVTATVSDFQANTVDVSKKTKSRVVDALKKWQQWKYDSGSWPTGELEDNDAPAILGYVSYGAGVVGLYPPAAAIAGPISVAAGTLSYLIPEQTKNMAALHAATAFGIHQGYVNDLDDVESGMRAVIDTIQTEPPEDGSTTGSQDFTSFTADVVGNRKDWSPPEVSL